MSDELPKRRKISFEDLDEIFPDAVDPVAVLVEDLVREALSFRSWVDGLDAVAKESFSADELDAMGSLPDDVLRFASKLKEQADRRRST